MITCPCNILQSFHGCRNNNNFQLKIVAFFLFLLKTEIVSTSYNRLDEAILTSTHNLCFRVKI